MKVIFLDIDGVLNSEEFAIFNINYFKRVGRKWTDDGGDQFVDPIAVKMIIEICETTGAKIVVSSSWRLFDLENTIKDFEKYRDLKPLIPYIVGVTPRLYFKDREDPWPLRGEEIQVWLDNNTADNYVIIDDDKDMLDSQLSHFVQTNALKGITEKNKNKIIKILS